ncbi:pilus assembly protein [Rhodopseudomonas palustris]|uniref:TadE/TadG family type IV pilus assembly protein n=1 Tax=Rhodopseudomonas palustris TaxID=1076 RepID=UPI00115DE1C6|nr:TadE/TadG family type IV pilus assembly protein [Rhodopseudomonas palustris]QDL98318.1 pilus assembly protein [Rhodopseudomonas palustris]
MRAPTDRLRRARLLLRRLRTDRRGVAATEFAIIVPLMLLMLLATVEVTSGIAADRKVTLVARTLSDLVSQATSVTDNDMKSVFAASYSVLAPYPTAGAKATITEIYIDKNNVAKVLWSKSGTVTQSGTTASAALTASPHGQGDTIGIPDGLKVADTFLIFSEFSYLYQPAIGYLVPKAGVSLSDTAYTRPRQSRCVNYPQAVACP